MNPEDSHETRAFNPNRWGEVPLRAAHERQLPPLPHGAAEPADMRPTYHVSNNSSHSLLHHETHIIDPFHRLTTSPIPMSPQPSRQELEHPRASRAEVIRHILRKTCGWVIGGIVIMLLGIGLLRAALLPVIFTCPVSAECGGSIDPSRHNALPLLQSFIAYWIKAGVIVSSVGILKLTAYQAWFILMHQGSSVKNLDLNLGAIRGSINDTARLLFLKNNRLLSIFVFALLGISGAINIIVALSIDSAPGTQSVRFLFNGTTAFPDSSAKNLNNDGQLKATERIITWALDNDQSHGGALKGTLVTPDARSSQASNALPGGPTMNAYFTCEGWDNYTVIPSGEKGWYIWVHDTRFIAEPLMSLSVSMYRVDVAVTSYLWVSNTTGLIPNATQTADGGMNIALCTHYYELLPPAPEKSGVQYLDATAPLTSGCASSDPDVCVSDSVNNAILNWWGGVGTAFWTVSCRGGLLGPTKATSDAERYCPITQDLFQATATGMLDAIMQTSPTSVLGFQQLDANVSGLNGSTWWLNATIPAATLVVYLIGLMYTCMLSQGQTILKELDLEEVVRAAQSGHIHDLVLSGQFRKNTAIRYRNDVGFVSSSTAPAYFSKWQE